MNIQEKLDHFKQVTLQDIEEQKQSTLEEYQIGLNTLYLEHQEEKLKQSDLTTKIETEKQKRLINKELSVEQLKITREINERKAELKQALVQELLELLEKHRSTEKYETFLIKQIEEALFWAKGDEIKIYLDPADRHLLTALQQKTKAQLQISKEHFLGGIRALIPSRSILFDRSFQTRLNYLVQSFSVSDILHAYTTEGGFSCPQ
ncbi:hypothetical protein FACS189418_3150 [Clostridia bacterium]|nr:hypothetical protein FACS189418_3150 [Clostridia bacterium]